jgi:hypothetical protein
LKKKEKYGLIFITFAMLFLQLESFAQKLPKIVQPIYYDKGKLNYTPDSLGNCIVDFSYCGYKASEQAIPNVDVKAVMPLVKGDATMIIQAALDYVATLPLDANGCRGAVLLQKGSYEILGQLRINAMVLCYVVVVWVQMVQHL